MSKLKWVFGAIAIAILSMIAIARTPDTDPARMLAKYGGEQARFARGHACGAIHYRDQGNTEGRAIVLIHGSNSSLQTWEGVVDGLAPTYRVLSLDLWGHGLTGPCLQRDYSARSYIEAVNTVLDAAQVESAVWVGNSMGGWVAWRAALDASERVSGLILLDSSGAQLGNQGQAYLGARLAAHPVGQAIVGYAMPRWIVRQSIEDNYADPARVTDALVVRYWELLRFPGNRRAIADRANADREEARWRDIDRVTAPTLIIWGEGDRVFPVSHARAFAERIQGARLITYPNVGHLPMEESPEAVARDIGNWLVELTPP
jgi:pimeloyl-ACP methyl ester carboxylesterase